MDKFGGVPYGLFLGPKVREWCGPSSFVLALPVNPRSSATDVCGCGCGFRSWRRLVAWTSLLAVR
jgi:hypothetical protein